MRRSARLALAAAALAIACRSPVPATLPPESPRPPARGAPEAVPPQPAPVPAPTAHQALTVTATAYNSLPSQGVGRGTHGAWGDRLSPGMKTVAISHDLIALGLTRGMQVEIEGLEGIYTVTDRLPRRWSRRIDIYMGRDVRAARAWGKREVKIRWLPSAAADAD
jgi:3D (Asp-Asp-Asp) domain-containing protein